jgi:two-component system heavy metal sensor histidine kinase CusS
MTTRSITLRLAALFCLTTSSVLIALGLYLGAILSSHFEEGDLEELRGKLELTGRLLTHVRSPDDFAQLASQRDTALVGHPHLTVLVSRAGGELVFASGGASFPGTTAAPGPADSVAAARPRVWERGETTWRGIAARLPVGIAGEAPATVTAAREIGHHRSFMTGFQRALWSGTALAIVLSALLGWAVARRGLGPLRDMSAHARSISADRLDAQLDTTQVPVELVELAQAFDDMLLRLRDAFKRLSDFSSDIAHELRTPISNLMTQTQVCLSQPRSAESYRETLYSNLEEYDRLARMVSDMLLLAKAENGQVLPERGRVDLAATVRELFEFYGVVADEQGVRLELDGTAQCDGDRLMLRRAVANLLSNAIRHTPAGGTVRVVLANEPEDGLLVRVENPGATIPAAHLPRLFDRFYRMDASRSRETEGAGLGLAITKAIVEAHRGRIGVASQHGVTRFEIRLPAAA